VRIVSALLIILGALLLAVAVYIYQPPQPYLDLHRAGSPLIELPVTDQPTHQVLKLRIPDDPAWKTLERELGQPQFLVGGVVFHNHLNHLLCPKAIALIVIVSTAGHPIPVRKADGDPEGYSSECEDVGFEFSATAGEQVEIEVSTRGFEEPGASDVDVVPVWPKSLKDAGVGADLEPLFRRVFWTTTTTGAVLLAAGIMIILIRRKRRKRSIAS
jgi:hypothetical protein